MIQRKFVGGLRRWGWVGLAFVAASAGIWKVGAQDRDGFAPSRVRRPPSSSQSLSECTALLEAAVRSLYLTIEPGDDTSPNELLAYADLRTLRLYTGALEVAGWSLEQASEDYRRYMDDGAYRGSRGRDTQSQVAHERYHAYRETVRSLLQRVRSTAVLCEHQISFCDIQVGRQWRQEVLPVLRDTIEATEPLFAEDVAYQRYGVPGQTTKVIPVAGTGIPGDAVEVGRNGTYRPYEGKGRGQGRYFEIRAYGGDVHVTAIRYRNHENAFGVLGTSGVRELNVDQVAEPGAPIYIPCNRKRWVDVSELEVEWEPAQRGRKVYATIELVEGTPDDPN